MPAHRADQDRLRDRADYEGSPFLTGLANFAAAAGVMIGCYAVIGLLVEWHRSFTHKLSLIVILATILVVNLTLQTVRWRYRRKRGLSRAWRRYRNDLGPRPPGRAPGSF